MPLTEIRRAVVKTVTFHNPDNGYSVLKLTRGSSLQVFTAVGNFPRLAPGETLDLAGEWIRDERYGEQFRTEAYKLILPTGREAVERYLGGGAIKGIGPSLAKKLVDQFGEEVFDVLDKHPERLDEIKDLRGKRKEKLLLAWTESQSAREVMFFLQAHNLSLGLSHRILRHYGQRAVEILKENPYRLAEEIWGIGFLKADDIARKLGFPMDCYERIHAGLAYALSRSSEEGHVFLSYVDLVQKSLELLQCEPETVVYTLDNLTATEAMKKDERGNYYLPYLYHSEFGIARRAGLLRLGLKPLPKTVIDSAIAEAEKHAGSGFHFSDEQRQGIAAAVNQGLFLLTGGPGTGKTTTVSAVLHVFAKAGLDVRLAAPTGRAARRMSEVTGHKASTLHRLLKYDPATRGFFHAENNPLPCDALVIDEVSMIDTSLMYSVLRAARPGTRVVLVGDPDQLPSVGAGKVLAEFIRSEAVPHLHLSKIFRQAEQSLIVTNAHRINRGLAPTPAEEDGGNFHLVERGDPESVVEAVVELACERLPKRFGYHPLADIQVLTPMNQGPLGTVVLNEALQQRLNPSGPAMEFRDKRFRKGDKVMQLRNNYDKAVFNGDIGKVERLDLEEDELHADFDGETVTYSLEELDQLGLAYAVSVHKSQGSEFKAVVLALTKSHWVMLQRNLLYTAITRAREQLVIAGQRAAVHRSVDNNPSVQRNTLLAERLREAVRGLN
jgi:exodeoxyribonuclease V alpha subunit